MMMPARSLFPRLVLTATLLLIFPTTTSLAQSSGEEDPAPIFSLGKRPFVVATAASANRLKDKATFMFDAAGFPEAVDAILSRLDENVNGLGGINWDRPAGVMVFLNSVYPPSFEFVAFLPMSSPDEFQQMMELGPVIMRQDPTEEGRYELITQRRNIQIRTQGDYAFIQLPPMDPDPAFDRELPEPSVLTAGLTSQFDIGITLDVEAVPKATRDLILNVMTSTMSTQIQRRDDEPESRYQMRRSWMQADIDGFKLLLDECQRMSIGLNLTPDEPGANIDFVIDVRQGTKMLEEIMASSTKPSYFTPLLSNESPISLSWSGVMPERDRERYDGVLEGFKGELARGIEENDLGTVPEEGSPLFMALSALQSTVREGHLDLFGQMYRDSAEKLAVVGALRVQDGDAVAAGLLDALMRFQGRDSVGEIETGFDQHAGVTFHRIEFDNPDAGATELFGAGPGITVGCGSRSLWICVGGEESFDVLKGVMDELTSAYENPTEHEIPASMRLVVHVNDMIELVQGAESANRKKREEERAAATEADVKTVLEAVQSPDKAKQLSQAQQRRNQWRERREARNRLFMEALAEGDDRIQVEARPTDNGMRMRARFDLGFVRGVGRMIGSNFTEN
ncbi:MAG: hypothetical protein RIK87_24330 [Fuerstiella sp.]